MNAQTGYSGTPLENKRGLKAGMIARIIRQPSGYFELFSHPPDGVIFSDEERTPKKQDRDQVSS